MAAQDTWSRVPKCLDLELQGKGRGEEIGFAEPCRNMVAGDKSPEHGILELMFLNREGCVMTKCGNEASVHSIVCVRHLTDAVGSAGQTGQRVRIF